MDNDSPSQYVMDVDLGKIMVRFVFLTVALGSSHHQLCKKEFWESAYGKCIVVLCRLALSFSVMYYVAYHYLLYMSPGYATRLSTYARMFTYSHNKYLIHEFYVLLIFFCYRNLDSLKYISPDIFGSFSISMVYPLLYIVMAMFFDASSTNWYIASFMSMPESTRFLTVVVLTSLSTVVDYMICTHLAHSESAVNSKLS